MSKPIIAAVSPKKVTLEQGQEYYFCACGRSKNQPFCDGSHAGTDFKPKAFTAEESGDAYLCQCKHTANVSTLPMRRFVMAVTNNLIKAKLVKKGQAYKFKPLICQLLQQPKRSPPLSLFIN